MEILNNFGIQPVLLIAQIVNFLIILFLLKKFFYKPIVKVLENRKRKIEESLENAQAIEERLKKTDEQNTQILVQARNRAQSLILDAQEEAQKITDLATLESRKTVEKALLEAKAQIELQKNQMQKKLEQETLSFVAEVFKKVLERTMKPEERQVFTSKAVGEILGKRK